MTKRSLQRLIKTSALVLASLLALSVRADLQERKDDRQEQKADGRDRDDDDDDRPGHAIVRLPTGQYVTPTAISDAVQQYLNPGLPAYPNFVAGEAVRSQLSPDGTTLAVLTAGQNSLYKPDGTVDVANSTQYIFLYNVVGANKANPALTQVIRQVNAHVGLVFAPDGNTLYAAGGNDDVVYVYTKSGGSFTAAPPIRLGHFPAGATGGARNKGLGIGVQPNASGMDISADGRTLVVANNYNDSISVIDTESRLVRYEHDLRPYFANNEGQSGRAGGTFPFSVVVKGNEAAYVSSDRDREVVAIDVSSPSEGHLIKRIKLDGNGLGMTLDASQSRLYVAQDNADQVAVIDTSTNKVTDRIDARAPKGTLPNHQKYTGAATSATLIIVTEDDVQDGPDHLDSHRGTAFVVGPYVKQGKVVSTRYSQINALRTIEDVLGTEHINLNTAFQRPMTDVFDTGSSGNWTYAAEASTVLSTTTLALAGAGNGVRFAAGPVVTPQHDAGYWDAVTAGFNFAEADQVPPAQFNRVLWTGLMGAKPYPVLRGQASASRDNNR